MKKIYFSGIGGIGMSALAQIALKQGNIVIGSDIQQSYITNQLQKMGTQIIIGQKESNITPDIDLFVYSSAIDKNNEEYRKAQQLQIPILHRSEFLNQILKDKKVIAITGSSGKTTTTTLTGIGMNQINIQTCLITGGWIDQINSNTLWNNSDTVVLEADESDGTLLNYPVYIGLITDLAVDINLNSKAFQNTPLNKLPSKLKEIYKNFINKIQSAKGKLIISEEKSLNKFIKENGFEVAAVFGTNPENNPPNNHIFLYFDNLKQCQINGYPFIEFDLKITYKNKQELIGKAKLGSIGSYNALNYTAAASIILTLTEDIKKLRELNQISQTLPLPKRRFEILLNTKIKNSRLIITDDYAHNPKKIKSLISNLNKVYKNYKRIAVFQPHRYTRTMMFWDKLKYSFFNLDYLIILPIYEAGEAPIPNINSKNLTQVIKSSKNNIKQITYLESFENTIDYLKKLVSLSESESKDTIIVFIGAGSVTKLAHKFAEEYALSPNFTVF
ncbi:MAG: Mur ligase domain-containing protein [bacterium]